MRVRSENGAGGSEVAVVAAEVDAIGLDQKGQRHVVVDHQPGIVRQGQAAQGLRAGDAFRRRAGLVAVLHDAATTRQRRLDIRQQARAVGVFRRDGVEAAQSIGHRACLPRRSSLSSPRAQKKRSGMNWPMPGRKPLASVCQV